MDKPPLNPENKERKIIPIDSAEKGKISRITREQIAVYFFESGVCLESKGETQQAIFEYENALKYNPDNIEAKEALRRLTCEEETSRIRSVFNKNINLCPKDAVGYYNLANFYNDEGERNKAIECYKKAIELDPTLTDSYIKLARIYEKSYTLNSDTGPKIIEIYQKFLEHNHTKNRDSMMAHHRISQILKFLQRLKGHREMIHLVRNKKPKPPTE